VWQIIRPDADRILKDEKCRASLARYFDALANRKHAKFHIARRLPAHFKEDDSTEKLWKLHEKITTEYYEFEKEVDLDNIRLDETSPQHSFFDLKIVLAKRILQACHFCERACKTNRLGSEVGACKCGKEIVMSSYFSHMGEEAELVPSGTIFTCGCTMRCLHCQNWTISQWKEPGEVHTPKELAAIVDMLREEGCRNANLVGGDPAPWLEPWLESFKHVKTNVPVVWNSNSYYSEETARLLLGFADVYLLDFKYGDDKCAERISEAPNYVKTAQRNFLSALKYGELIIRVLILPGHAECCMKQILKWIAENLGTQVRINIMDQYRPEWRAREIPELRRRLNHDEYKVALEYAAQVGLNNLA